MRKITAAIIGLNILIVLFVFSIINQERQLEVVFFDVGQGSSIFIQTPNKGQVLIDGGPDNLLILEHLAKEMPFWDRSIDIVISTHSSADHLTGLIEVLTRFKIDKIVWTGMAADSLTHNKFKRSFSPNTEIIIAQFGQKFQLEEEIYFEILNPLIKLNGADPISHNNNSVVVRLNFNDVSFLFASDIERERELVLVQKQEIIGQNFLSADILKIPHHGSRSSTSYEFLEAVNPALAIIQVGRNNKFGHPHQDVIHRLKEKKIDIFRTDLVGTIKVISDGNEYKLDFQQ